VENNKHSAIAGDVTGEVAPRDSRAPLASLNGQPLLSNRGIPLNLDWVKQVRVNTSAVERRAQTHVTRRTVKKNWQAAWLLRAITCMDLTTLSGDDTDERVRRLCAKGRQPIQRELVKCLGIEDLGIQVAAICVYHRFVETARRALEGSPVRVAAVATGFPAGLSPLSERIAKFTARSRLGRKRLTSSSPALTFLGAGGKNFTMRSLPSNRRVVRRI
jgi:deoxyribose-phosphate aldolase